MEQLSNTGVLRQLFQNETTVRVGTQATMPDYCDDIRRVIRVEARAHITRRQVYLSGGMLHLDVEGSVAFQLIYRGEVDGEESGVCSHNFTEEFHDGAEFPYEGTLPEPHVFFCEAQVQTASCRPLSGKKPDFTASLHLTRRLFANEALALPVLPQTGIESKSVTEQASFLAGAQHEQFHINEEINLPHEYAPIQSLLDCSLSLMPAWVKPTGGQLVFGAEAVLTCCYLAESEEDALGAPRSFSQPIELSELLEFPACAAEHLCEVSLCAQSLKVQVVPDSYGAHRVLKVECAYEALAAAYGKGECRLLTDAYALGGVCETTRDTLSWEELLDVRVLHREMPVSFKLPAACTCAENVLLRFVPAEVSLTAEGVLLQGKLLLSALAADAEGVLDGIEAEEEISLTLGTDFPPQIPAKSLCAGLTGEVHSAAATLVKDALQVQAQFTFTLRLSRCEDIDCLSAVNFLPQKQEQDFCGIRFYYPCAGETLWEVGKRFGVPCAALAAQNDLAPDAALPAMVKIVMD